MKRKTRRAALFAAAAAAISLLPTAFMLVLTRDIAFDHAQARLDEMAESIAERTRTVLWGTEGALASVDFIARSEGCGGPLVSALAAALAARDWIRGMAYFTADGRLACTSYAAFDPPLSVPERRMELLGSEGSAVRFTPPVDTSFMPGTAILAVHRLERGAHTGAMVVAAVAPFDLLGGVDATTLDAGVAARVTIGGRVVASEGAADGPAGDRLSLERDVGLFDARVQTTAGRDWALAKWWPNARLIGGLGALTAIVLVTVAVRLAGRRTSMRDDLRDALENGELAVYYQPVIDLRRDRCVGAEALIRWRQASGAMISPDVFVKLAEDTGDIVPITSWLIARVGEEIGERLRADPGFHIAINLAPIHFSDANVSAAAEARAIADKADIPLHQLQFEITERALVDEARCKAVIAALNDQGNEVAIDDFGTGYSSLAYVGTFRVNYLKIDQAFVRTIGTDAASAGLADIIVDMAKTLRLKVIAEGVESEAQAAHLRARGVELAQGWLYSKPVPADEFLAFVERYNMADRRIER